MYQNLINLLVAIFICDPVVLIKFAVSEGTSCEPSGILTYQEKIEGAKESNSCSCKSPCDKVNDFVQFYYMKSQNSYRQLNVQNPKSNELYDHKGSVKILFHGYTDQGTKGWMPATGKQLAKVSNGYVILVDYGQISKCKYEDLMRDLVPKIANYVASVVKSLKLNLQNIELIGHSLGAQLTGYVGAALNSAVQRITGLDPAGPGYDSLNMGLNKSCAKFVQVLHTEPNGFGTKLLRGNVDFFANNRSSDQPGCNYPHCSHVRAFLYYYASLDSKNRFIGSTDCEPNAKGVKNTSIFGQFNDGKSGVFCFDTESCNPYAKNN